jgi:hypothetical protein
MSNMFKKTNKVVLTPKETAVPGALAKAKEILAGLGENGYMLNQFDVRYIYILIEHISKLF